MSNENTTGAEESAAGREASELSEPLGGNKYNLDDLTPETLRYMVTDLMEAMQNTETLRDKFAKAAMQGLLANSYADGRNQPNCTAPPEVIAQWAYEHADAMLAARRN